MLTLYDTPNYMEFPLVMIPGIYFLFNCFFSIIYVNLHIYIYIYIFVFEVYKINLKIIENVNYFIGISI